MGSATKAKPGCLSDRFKKPLKLFEIIVFINKSKEDIRCNESVAFVTFNRRTR